RICSIDGELIEPNFEARLVAHSHSKINLGFSRRRTFANAAVLAWTAVSISAAAKVKGPGARW
ncbi:MAG TPA: hypothetical protein VHM93_23995, partial [Candidatus Acidoferrum sp.]|nr:hypothetical protein [Candidatus Acidoferrum sp.]